MAFNTIDSNQMTYLETFNYIQPLSIFYEIPKAIVLSHDNQKLYIAKNFIHVIDLNNANILNMIYESDQTITCIALSFDDSRLASGDESGKVQVFDTISNEILKTITNFKCFIPFIKFLPNSNEKMIIGYQEKALEYWYLKTNEFKKLVYGNYVMGAAISENGKNLYVVGEDEMTFYDLENETSEKKRFQSEFYAVFSHDQTRLILANWNGNVTIINLLNNTSKVFKDSANDGWLNYLVVSHDDQLVAASGNSKNVFVYSIKDPHLLHIFERNCPVEVQTLMFTRDNRFLISSFDVVYICMWDLATKEKCIIGQHKGKILYAKMTDNALKFVTCAEDGIKVWDAVGFDCIGKVNGHTGKVLGMVLNKEKTKLVSSGCDNYVKFWNLSTGKETDSMFIDRCLIGVKLTGNKYVLGSCDNIIYVYKSNL